MQFVKFSNVLSQSALAKALAGTPVPLEEYNALVVHISTVRDGLRQPNADPRVNYDGPVEAFRGMVVPVVGWTSPRDLDDQAPAGSTPASQVQYMRAQYASALSQLLANMAASSEVVRGTSSRNPAGTGAAPSGMAITYEGPVAVVGDTLETLIDPAFPATTQVQMAARDAQAFRDLAAGMASTVQAANMAAQQQPVPPSMLTTAEAGISTAQALAGAHAQARRTANLRAGVAFGAALGLSWLVSR